MEVYTPSVGYSYNVSDQIGILATYPEKVVAQLFIMCGYGHETDAGDDICPDWYEHEYSEENINIAQILLSNANENGYIVYPHYKYLKLGYFVTLIAPNPNDRFNLVAIVRHGRMCKFEGLDLLKLLAHHNILTIPVSPSLFPVNYLDDRRIQIKPSANCFISEWTPQIWDDYIKYILCHIPYIGERIFNLNRRVEIPD
jgi:hypothetical protein